MHYFLNDSHDTYEQNTHGLLHCMPLLWSASICKLQIIHMYIPIMSHTLCRDQNWYNMVPTHHGLLYGKCMSMAGHHICNAIWINCKIIIIHKSHWLCIYTSSYQRWFTNLLYSQNLVSMHPPIFYPSNILPLQYFATYGIYLQCHRTMC